MPGQAGGTLFSVASRSSNFTMGDGSVKFIKSTVHGAVWRALGTVGGGEVVGSEGY